ncbi:PAS domain-containing protein [Rhodoplanes roseus]|uniref:PAS fold-4 domain-containing protein n=1 Tax=Rhodoplanes roseus TaxID=29409 RepID=A0A327KZ78_9BRAD|nr:PAS domain-containing protein [Rhodoplanes roseus]RAI42925.1 hypothetical protein CH341_16965 [Rhodoplanes roseus]
MWNLERLEQSLPDLLAEKLVTIAQLSKSGEIQQVNRAWRRFGLANGLRLFGAGVGENYFQFSLPDQVEAFTRIVTGDQDEMTLLYPCHSPPQVRWMLMVAAPLELRAGTGLIIVHVDVTEEVEKWFSPCLLFSEPLHISEGSGARPLLRVLEFAVSSAIGMERVRTFWERAGHSDPADGPEAAGRLRPRRR